MTIGRRDVAGAFLCVACLGASRTLRATESKVPEASEAKKATQEAVRYQNTPKGIQSCEFCSLFIKPDECKVVEGKVSPDGWCAVFDMVD